MTTVRTEAQWWSVLDQPGLRHYQCCPEPMVVDDTATGEGHCTNCDGILRFDAEGGAILEKECRIVEFPVDTPASTVDEHLHSMTDGSFNVVAIEVFDAPTSKPDPKGEAGVIGPWVCGPEDAVLALLAERRWEDYAEQYSEGGVPDGYTLDGNELPDA